MRRKKISLVINYHKQKLEQRHQEIFFLRTNLKHSLKEIREIVVTTMSRYIFAMPLGVEDNTCNINLQVKNLMQFTPRIFFLTFHQDMAIRFRSKKPTFRCYGS